MYGQPIFNKGAENIQLEMDSSTKGAGKPGYSHANK